MSQQAFETVVSLCCELQCPAVGIRLTGLLCKKWRWGGFAVTIHLRRVNFILSSSVHTLSRLLTGLSLERYAGAEEDILTLRKTTAEGRPLARREERPEDIYPQVCSPVLPLQHGQLSCPDFRYVVMHAMLADQVTTVQGFSLSIPFKLCSDAGVWKR